MDSQGGVQLHQLHWLCDCAIGTVVNSWAVWAGCRVLEKLHGMAGSVAGACLSPGGPRCRYAQQRWKTVQCSAVRCTGEGRAQKTA